MYKIRVLVVDDSALMRKIISDMINDDPSMEAVGTARNGEDLLDKLSVKFRGNMPDMITLDVEMPKMDGITALKELKKRGIDIPVIVLSSISKEGTKLTMECLEAGAFDFLPKPSGTISLDINKVKMELVQKIKAAYGSINRIKKSSKHESGEKKTYRCSGDRGVYRWTKGTVFSYNKVSRGYWSAGICSAAYACRIYQGFCRKA